MKVLFASPQCLLDPSSGASLSCRSILEGLAARGHTVRAISSTVFDIPRYSNSTDFLRHVGARALGQSTSQKKIFGGWNTNALRIAFCRRWRSGG